MPPPIGYPYEVLHVSCYTVPVYLSPYHRETTLRFTSHNSCSCSYVRDYELLSRMICNAQQSPPIQPPSYPGTKVPYRSDGNSGISPSGDSVLPGLEAEVDRFPKNRNWVYSRHSKQTGKILCHFGDHQGSI
jgi:hypothetical protein